MHNIKKNGRKSFKIGVALVVLGILLYLSLLAVPFLSISSEDKVGIVAIGVVIGEIMFWLGAILAGQDIIRKYKHKINPKNWFK